MQRIHFVSFDSPSLFRTYGNDNIVALCPNDVSTERLAAIFCAGAVSSSLEAVAWPRRLHSQHQWKHRR
jgi:hypothetical protein